MFLQKIISFEKKVDVQLPPTTYSDILDNLSKVISSPHWFAGGFCRKAFCLKDNPTLKLKSSDIDIWFPDEKSKELAKLDLMKYYNLTYGSSLSSNSDINTFENCDQLHVDIRSIYTNTPLEQLIKIQLITKRYYPSVLHTLDDFDFTVAQVGYSKGQYYFGEKTIDHIEKKILSFNRKSVVNPKRLLKYLGLGFTPDQQTFKSLIEMEFPNTYTLGVLTDGYELF